MKKDEAQGIGRRIFLKVMGAAAAATMVAPAATSAQSTPQAGREYSGEKIDMFCHIIPPKFKEALLKKASSKSYYLQNTDRLPALTNLDLRFKAMDRFEGLREVLDLGAPPLEHLLSPKDAAEAARIANDEMAELVAKHPDRFVGAVAGLPMNDVDAALRETDRTVKELKFKGVQLYSSINGKPLDRPEFLPLYEKMAQYDLPIWIHPVKDNNIGDYADEKYSKYSLFNTFGWPYETTLAMSRLVFSGIMEKYPTLKFISHHCGAMLPFFRGRVGHTQAATQPGEVMKLTRPPLKILQKILRRYRSGWEHACSYVRLRLFRSRQYAFRQRLPVSRRPRTG